MPRDGAGGSICFRERDPAELESTSPNNDDPIMKSKDDVVPNGEARKHRCSICSKSFTSTGHLSRHMKTHSGEKKYQCPFPGCSTRTARADNLQQHFRIHLAPRLKRNSRSLENAVVIDTRRKRNPGKEQSLPPLDCPPALELTTLTVGSVKAEDTDPSIESLWRSDSIELPPCVLPADGQPSMGYDGMNEPSPGSSFEPRASLHHAGSPLGSQSNSQQATEMGFSNGQPAGRSYPDPSQEPHSRDQHPPEFTCHESSPSPLHPVAYESMPQSSLQISTNIPYNSSFGPSSAAQISPECSPTLSYPSEVPSPLTGISISSSNSSPQLSRRALCSVSGSSFVGSHPPSPYSEFPQEFVFGTDANPSRMSAEIPLMHPIPRPANPFNPSMPSPTLGADRRSMVTQSLGGAAHPHSSQGSEHSIDPPGCFDHYYSSAGNISGGTDAINPHNDLCYPPSTTHSSAARPQPILAPPGMGTPVQGSVDPLVCSGTPIAWDPSQQHTSSVALHDAYGISGGWHLARNQVAPTPIGSSFQGLPSRHPIELPYLGYPY